MLKKKLRCRSGLLIALFTAGLLCACSSNKSAPINRVPDYCNSPENRNVPKINKKSTVPPGKDTPIGGDYR